VFFDSPASKAACPKWRPLVAEDTGDGNLAAGDASEMMP
jgi:hypothetical protein